MARDADAPSSSRSLVTTSRTAELVFAANLVASDPALRSGFDPDWVAQQRALLPAEALSIVPRIEGFWWPTMGLVDFLCWNGQFQDPEAFLDDVAKVPIERYLTILFNGDFTEDQVRSLIADPVQAQALGENLCQFSSAQPGYHESLFRDPEGHRRGLIALIRASDTPLFRETFDQWTAAAVPTIRAIERRLVNEDPFTVAESLRQKPTLGPRQFDHFTFIPARLIGHRHIRSWGGGNYLFFLQEGNLTFAAPNETGAELAEFLKVLGDKTRMDILRLLCCRPSYGKEIAASLGLTTATVSRHLDQLKASGLVREDRADAHNVKRVQYVAESLDTQLERLKTYLFPA